MCMRECSSAPVYEKCIKDIRNLLSEASLYEQLAEECAELAQACHKKARKLRGENYTPKSMEEIDDSLIEEYTDVTLAASTCGIIIDWDLKNEKAKRWIERVSNNV